jgi:hypothetical protein
MILLAFSLQAACRTATCMERAEPLDRDLCLHDEVLALPPTDVEGVATRVSSMTDGIVRGSAVNGWVERHRGRLPPSASRVCDLLPPTEAVPCHRHVEAAHLNP